jgi:hypothetical protein
MNASPQDQKIPSAANTVAPAPRTSAPQPSREKGEVPASLLDRYLIERDRQGRPERFYRDHRAFDPMFKDEGRRLVTRQTYPDAVADMMTIARHRGWTQVRVAGDEAFRREAWLQGQKLGLEVSGYKPRERDRQAAGDRVPPARPSHVHRDGQPLDRRLDDRLSRAAVVVRQLIPDPRAQVRLLEQAYSRARDILDKTRGRENDRTRR